MKKTEAVHAGLVLGFLVAMSLACEGRDETVAAGTPEGGATPKSAEWRTYEDHVCRYSLRYPANWSVYALTADAELPPFYLQPCALVSTASGIDSVHDMGDTETARVIIWRESRQGQESLVEWVADRWPWIGALPEQTTLGDLPALRLSREAAETAEAVGAVKLWLAGEDCFYALDGYVRRGADYDELVETITQVETSFAPTRN